MREQLLNVAGDRLAFFRALGELCGEIFERQDGLVRFAEGHVERHNARAVVVQCVHCVGEANARKRPAAEHLLRVLVDVDDGDARIDRRLAAQLKTRIEAGKLKPLDEIENRHGPFAEKRPVVDGDRRDSHRSADGERNPVLLPLAE